jgi:putative flippase GtrA
MVDRQFLRFLVAGAIAAAANFGSRFVFSLFVGYVPAIVLAYGVGMAVAFTLMRGHVFSSAAGTLGGQIVRFTLVNAVALIQTVVISVVLARWALPYLGVSSHIEAIAHFFGVAVPVGTSYLGHKFFTFRHSPGTPL